MNTDTKRFEGFGGGLSRRQFLSRAVLGAAGVGAGIGPVASPWTQPASGRPAAAARSKRPNLVFVFADQLRRQSCGYAGDPLAHTPHLDRLASQGVDLAQAISNTPVCAPYRASLLTGKHCSGTGMVINELRLSPEHRCIGHVLGEAGYRTGYIGKWHLWANQLGHHDEVFNGFTPPGPYRLGFDDHWAAYNFNHDYFDAPYYRAEPRPRFWDGYEPDAQTDMALDYLRASAAGGRPFALFMSWGPPHDPWGWDNVPAEFADLFRDTQFERPPNFTTVPDPYTDPWTRLPDGYADRVNQYQQCYYAQTASLDANVGRIMEALDRLGLADDTLLVFTSDHGEMFGAHGRRAKYTFYEEACRVPLLMRWKGHLPEGAASDVCLGTPDIMPTLLSMLGLPIPGSVEGRDLSGAIAIAGGGGGAGGSGGGVQLMQGMGATADWIDGVEWRAVRDGRYTFAIYRRDGRRALYDHQNDPYQLENLAEDPARRRLVAHYHGVLKRRMAQVNDTFEACTWYRDHWTDDRNITLTADGTRQDPGNLAREVREAYPDGPSHTRIKPET